MDSLVHFLNHSLLPFTGRQAELTRLMQFFAAAATVQELRAALLVGEAGIGKSRLIEEFIPRVAETGGAVIRAKLRPGGTASLLPLIAEGIWISNAGQHLLKSQPEPTLDSVTSAMQRLCRLRPTILIVEDIHLLQGDTYMEFTHLLESLSEEMLSLLCAARPVAVAARGVLERYLVDEMNLSGLSSVELNGLTSEMFGMDPDPELIAALQQATLGNPLALRSALRGAVASGTIALDNARRQWHTTRFGSELSTELRHNVRLLTEGMAAHLSRQERTAAEQLSCLGEVFGRETALVILQNHSEMLEELAFKGIILPTTTPSHPLPGLSSSSTPLAFTHSLVHKYFVEHAAVKPDTLISVLHNSLPLYSVMAFELVSKAIRSVESPPEILRGVCDKALQIVRELEITPDWELGMPILETSNLLISSFSHLWTKEDALVLNVNYYNRLFCVLESDPDGKARRISAMDQMIRLTESPESPAIASYRMLALGRQFHSNYPDETAVWTANRLEVQELIARMPALRSSNHYIWYLTSCAQLAVLYHDSVLSRTIENELHDVLNDPDVPDDKRNFARRRIGLYLVPVFDTQEELEARRTMLAELQDQIPANDQELLTVNLFFLERIGDFKTFRPLCERAIALFDKNGVMLNANNARMQMLRMRLATGDQLDSVLRDAVRLINSARGEFRTTLLRSIGQTVTTIGALRGDLDWVRKLSNEMDFDLGQHPNVELRILLALDSSEDAAGQLGNISATNVLERRVNGVRLLLLIRLLNTQTDNAESMFAEEAGRILNSPVLRITDPLIFRATIQLIVWAAANMPGWNDLVDTLKQDIRTGLENTLEWMQQRDMASLMSPLIDRYGKFLTNEEMRLRRQFVAESESTQLPRANDETMRQEDQRILVSLLGTISVTNPGDQEPQRLRGARQRTLLGVLAADAMNGFTLEHRDFCMIASGGEEDPEYARKYMNNAVHRVRDIVGRDAIRTDTKVPQLNFDLVRVDIVDAYNKLKTAQDALRDNALSRATTELLGTLEITRGEVAFPSLYDEFFERLREQIDNRLRGLIISVSKALLRERDAENAERILQKGYAYTPDDEEFAELLYETLCLLGRTTEADQIRRKTMRALSE